MTHIELLNEDVQLATTYTMLPSQIEGGGGGCSCDTDVCGVHCVTCNVAANIPNPCVDSCGDYCIHCPLDWY